MKEFSQDEVSKLLNVPVDTLKQWRASRLQHSPLALKPTGETVSKSRRYTIEDLTEWLTRNPDRLALLQFADEERRAMMLPLARAHAANAPDTPSNDTQEASIGIGKGLMGAAA